MGLHRSCLAATPTESQDFVFQTLHRRSTPSRRALSGTWPKPSTIEDFCFRRSACAPRFGRFASVCDLLALFTGDKLTIRHGRKKNKKRIAKFPPICVDNPKGVFGSKGPQKGKLQNNDGVQSKLPCGDSNGTPKFCLSSASPKIVAFQTSPFRRLAETKHH